MIIRDKLRLLSLVAAPALMLGACAGDMASTSADASGSTEATSSSGSMSTGAAASANAMPTDARGFVTMAASSDMFELKSSQLAKSRGATGEINAFADHMIADHTKTSTQLTSLMGSMNPPMSMPTSMTERHQAMLRKVEGAGTGAAFNRAYVEAQLMSHQEAVALFSTYAQNGDNPALRTFAQTNLPALQGHLEHAQRLQASMR